MFQSLLLSLSLAATAPLTAVTDLSPEQRKQWCESIEDVVIDSELAETSQHLKLLDMYKQKGVSSRVLSSELLYYTELSRSRFEFERLFKEKCEQLK